MECKPFAVIASVTVAAILILGILAGYVVTAIQRTNLDDS